MVKYANTLRLYVHEFEENYMWYTERMHIICILFKVVDLLQLEQTKAGIINYTSYIDEKIH